MVYGDGQFVAVGGDGAVLTSQDGLDWSLGTADLNPRLTLRAVTYGAGRYVAVGDQGTILTSEDGRTWTSREAGTDGSIYDVTYADGRFVAVGPGMLLSPDGSRWGRPTREQAENLAGVTYGAGQFVAVGAGAKIHGSADGDQWAPREIGASWLAMYVGNGRQHILDGVAYGGGRFVAVGSTDLDAAILRSDDGVRWTLDRSAHDFPRRVRYANGQFLIVGELTLLSSPDGVEWTSRRTAPAQGLQDAAFGNGRWVAVGWDGTILTSN